MNKDLKQWAKARERLDKADREAAEAQSALEEAGKRYRREHPIPEEIKTKLINLYKSGKPLCCTQGRVNLTDAGLAGCWVEYLNDWAYDSLGCSETYHTGGFNYEHGLARLRGKLHEDDKEKQK